ncbi:MAG TPA: S8 family serine peptidase [Chitinophagaceae bacterium]|nr:S8 family serine peptidase [Chitinophagaceae bacterium]
MKSRIILVSFFFFSILSSSFSQFSKYIIRFKDKNNSPFSLTSPSAYLSPRAIQRRLNQNINIDSTDLPVNPAYIQAVLNTGSVNLLNRSKWLNAITIQTTDNAALTAIQNLSFVKEATPVALRFVGTNPVNKFFETPTPIKRNVGTNKLTTDYYNYGPAIGQINLHKGQFLHNIGLRGQGIVISMLDGGFFGFPTNTSLDSARNNNQFLGTWDFVSGEPRVDENDAHGLYCLSMIAANWPGTLVGTAPKAGFWLFRTEDSSTEQPIEEYNWATGAEYADSVGSDIISSSLGYRDFDNASFNHSYADLDGNTTPCTIAADMAAKKGMIVVNSAGNAGNDPWKYIIAPADGDSVFAIGATNTNGTIASFSSYGPAYDGRTKPNVVSPGQSITVAGTNSQPGTASGTSFSCPNMAGLSACLWQAFPEFNNIKIINAIQRSADRYNNPHEQYGYGIPDMKIAFGNLLAEFATSSAEANECKINVRWMSKDLSTMRYEIERKLPDETVYSKIGETNGQGSSLTNHSYQFADELDYSPAGTLSYRIKQIIDTAASTLTAVYIDTANVVLSNPCINLNEDKIIVYPNPTVNGEITVSVYTKDAIDKLQLGIYSLNGNIIYKLESSKAPGKKVYTLPISRLARGKYIITVYNDKKKIKSVKFIKSL